MNAFDTGTERSRGTIKIYIGNEYRVIIQLWICLILNIFSDVQNSEITFD